MNLNEIVRAQTVPFIVLAPIAALVFFISSLAENGRAPFDLLEAESEIVAGFNMEYSGLKFGFFFVGDFLHAFTIALLFAVIFLGGWNGPAADRIPILGFVYLMIKTSIMYFLGSAGALFLTPFPDRPDDGLELEAACAVIALDPDADRHLL